MNSTDENDNVKERTSSIEESVSLRVEVQSDKECCCCVDSETACQEKKTTFRSEQHKKKMINRLRRIEGQVRGLEAMVEKNAYCNDILQQSAAVNAAVNAFNRELISSHMKSCVARDLREGKDEIIDELVLTLQKLMK